jgi:outer membrane protein TolC
MSASGVRGHVRCWLAACAGLALLCTASNAVAQDPLAIDERTVVMAVTASSPGVLAARHDAASADEEAARAARARLPGLTLSARYTRLSSIAEKYRTVNLDPSGATPPIVFPQLLNNYNARASLEINVLDPFLRLAAAAEAAGELAAARHLEARAVQARAIFEARSAYFALRRAHLGKLIAEDAFRAAMEQERLERDRVTAGTAPPTRALGFSVLVHGARTRREVANAEVTAAEAALRQYLRIEDGARPLVLASPPDNESQERVAPSRGVTHAVPPGLRALEKTTGAMAAKMREESWALLPRLVVTANGDVSAPSARVIGANTLTAVPTWDLGAVIEIPVTQLFAQTRARAAANSAHAAAAARLDEARRLYKAQREGAQALRVGAEARLVATRQALLATRTLVEARRGEFAAGVAIALDVMNAESELLRARNDVADAEFELRLSEARIDFLDGRDALQWTTQEGAQ